jgi:hypothetical protein
MRLPSYMRSVADRNVMRRMTILLVPISVRGRSEIQGRNAAGRITSMPNSNDIGNRTRDLPACSAVPQLTGPPRERGQLFRAESVALYRLISATARHSSPCLGDKSPHHTTPSAYCRAQADPHTGNKMCKARYNEAASSYLLCMDFLHRLFSNLEMCLLPATMHGPSASPQNRYLTTAQPSNNTQAVASFLGSAHE